MALLVDLTASKPTVEAMSTTDGVCRGTFINSDEKAHFTHWGYLAGVTYNGETPPEPDIDWLSFHPTRTLRYNDKGDDVKLLQLALKHQNGADLSGTGKITTPPPRPPWKTSSATPAWMSTVSAAATPGRRPTSRLLPTSMPPTKRPSSVPSAPCTTATPVMTFAWLQLALNEAIDAGLSGTGSFLSATETAVREFQADQGLDVDGIVGKDTWRALGFSPNY